MENKNVGYLIIGISILTIFIIFLFNNAMTQIITNGCPAAHLGVSCPAYGTITQQTYLSLGVVGLLVLVGLVLIFSKPQKEIQREVIFKTKTIEKKIPKKIFDLSDLKIEEKQVFELIQNNKAIFQSDLIEKTGFGKAKMTRIIDRLEGKGFVERKRRGMTNVVVLKE
ncbi:MarR family transcriptional regulator [Candidatus Woesearchaeota archaeon]|nr:MarR family transcriptional regulator [Candidatus Woesearchaeota archaeon]